MSIVLALMLAASPVRLPPVEQCAKDAAFDSFRAQLEASVASRDLANLTSVMAPDVRLSFGGAGGAANLRNHFGSEEKLWSELDQVLRLGCATARSGDGVEYRAWPAMFITGGDLDGFETWVSLPGAVQRRRPDASAGIVQRLPSWTVLSEVEDAGGSFIAVRTPKGRRGFVARSEVRSIIDYRLIAQRRDGRWMITAFVAGD